MGLFAKIKNIFYDEEYVEVPEKEVRKEIEPKIEEVIVPPKVEVPEVEPKIENTFSERDLFKAERTFNFPAFDDEDEEEVEAPKVTNVLEVEKTRARVETVYKEAPIEEKKVFKPSPVISPIYGILDKNYKKDEIPERKESVSVKANTNEKNYDYVRRKAYGTLEDEFRNDISNASIDVLEKVNDIEKEIDSLDTSKDHIEDLLNEIEVNNNLSIGELEEKMKDKMEAEEDKALPEIPIKRISDEKFDETISDQTLEHDLFNLIDSMYEDKEE